MVSFRDGPSERVSERQSQYALLRKRGRISKGWNHEASDSQSFVINWILARTNLAQRSELLLCHAVNLNRRPSRKLSHSAT